VRFRKVDGAGVAWAHCNRHQLGDRFRLRDGAPPHDWIGDEASWQTGPGQRRDGMTAVTGRRSGEQRLE
jgi:hypothetical protein